MKKLIFILFSLFFSFSVSAAVTRFPVGKPASNGHQTYWNMNTGTFEHDWDMDQRDRYINRNMGSGPVSNKGVNSISNVNATVVKSVSRPAILAKSFGIAKAGARLATRAAPIVGSALLLKDAYDIVKGSLESEGWEYDPASDEFLKYWDNTNCITELQGVYPNEKRVNVACYGVDSSTIRAYNLGGKDMSDAKYLMESKMEALARPYWADRAKKLDEESGLGDFKWTKYTLNKCNFDLNGGVCSVIYKGDVRNTINFRLKATTSSTALTSDEFLQIATPSIDGNPTPFVEAADRPIYSENVEIASGTVLQTAPFTDSDGKVKQLTFNFGRDSSGATTVTVTETPRPDLNPGSPSAPNPGGSTGSNPGSNTGGQPGSDGAPGSDGQPKPNPGGSTGSNPGSNTGGQPGSDGAPGSDGQPKPNPNPDDKPDDKPQDGFLCSLFPDILACQKMGEPDESIFDDIQIPQVVDDTTWQPDNFLPLNGVCPQPKSFHVVGREFIIDYSPLCSFMGNVRMMILLAFTVAAAYISFGGLRSDK